MEDGMEGGMEDGMEDGMEEGDGGGGPPTCPGLVYGARPIGERAGERGPPLRGK